VSTTQQQQQHVTVLHAAFAVATCNAA
jgi:hypothetical protein